MEPKSARKGDHVYFRHPGGMSAGEVKAVGEHGVTVHSAGDHHKVRWADLLGHKVMARHRYGVVDEGEGGAILRGEDGDTIFVAGEPQKIEGEEEMAKSRQVLMFVRGGTDLFMKAAESTPQVVDGSAEIEGPSPDPAGIQPETQLTTQSWLGRLLWPLKGA